MPEYTIDELYLQRALPEIRKLKAEVEKRPELTRFALWGLGLYAGFKVLQAVGKPLLLAGGAYLAWKTFAEKKQGA